MCLLLECLLLEGMAVHAMSTTHTESLLRNYLINMPCTMSAASVREMLLNTTYLHLAAREWSATHIIREWRSTDFSAEMDAAAAQYVQEYKIPHDTLHAQVQYVSEVKLPHVLSSFMNIHVPLHITKHAYVTGSAIYTVTEITDLPVVGECVIYSRHVVAVDDQKASLQARNTVTYPAIPWYLKIVQPVIEQQLRDSLWLQSWAMARAWCGQLHMLD